MLQILAERIKEPSDKGIESRVPESLLLQMQEDLEVFLNSVSYSCLEKRFEDFSNFKEYPFEDFSFKVFFSFTPKVINIRCK